MDNYFELRKQHKHALDKAETIVKVAEDAHRELTATEQRDFDMAMSAAKTLDLQLRKVAEKSTLRAQFPNGRILTHPNAGEQVGTPRAPVKQLSAEYPSAFHTYVQSNGKKMEAALYEGADQYGGYAVPVVTADGIVQLAPPEMGIRSLATILPTTADLKIPRGTAIGAAAIKAESGAVENSFGETDPTLDQFTLSAFMVGNIRTLSFELAADVPSFQSFCIDDLLLAISILEEGKFVAGTGTGEPQGLKGNVGAGVTGVAAGSDTYASELLDATFDVLSALNAMYHPGASWLMGRATSIVLRKAQKAANLYIPVFTREGGRDYLHGYPVAYSTSMDAVGAGKTPIMFGDFKRGYVIGDRGGSGVNIKVLDQVKAAQGLILLLGYRRTDGRVRRSEAIQGISTAP